MYKKKILPILIMAALAGCDDDNHVSTGGGIPSIPDTGTPDTGNPDTGTPQPTIISGEFSLDGTKVYGSSVNCNGEPANAFEFEEKDTVTCRYDGTVLATFSNVTTKQLAKSDQAITRHRLNLNDADEFVDSPDKARNAHALLTTVSPTHGNQIDIELTAIHDKLAFASIYNNDLSLSPEAFDSVIAEKPAEENLADKNPSAHVPDIEPEVTPGTSTDLNASFVSANAEEAYQYKPTEVILSKAVITDSTGLPVEGLSYFSHSSRGKTNAAGEFDFAWGESISFGIDTFELGDVRGNKTEYQLIDLGADQRGRNADALVKRYADNTSNRRVISEKITDVFAMYPNVINEAISLSLNDKDTVLEVGGGLTETVSAEFEKQFENGIASLVDDAICGSACGTSAFSFFSQPTVHTATDDLANIQADINKLWGINDALTDGWKPVQKFHVFTDATNFYGSTGLARGQAAVNISNQAFPVMMARNDNNYWLSFGEKKAYDERNLAYITEKPSTQKIDVVGKNTATFNLPFVTIGEMGKGKVMVVGNGRYNSILVCPNDYSWASNGQCGEAQADKDGDDMKNFFSNVIRYLTNRAADERITVGTNIPHVYFARHGQVIGVKADYVISPEFNVDTEQLSSFDGINPIDMPLLIINGFEYKNPNGNPYTPPHSADVAKPKLTQDDVTALIEYVNNGGSVLMMETIIQENNTGATGRFLDAAGIAFGMGDTVVLNGNGPNDGYADRPRANREHALWIIERYAAKSEGEGQAPKLPYSIDKTTGEVIWDIEVGEKLELETAFYQAEINGELKTLKAFIREEDHFVKDEKGKWIIGASGKPVLDEASLQLAKDALLDQFLVSGQRTYQECKRTDYHYEINCLERRPGNGIPLTGGMERPIYTKLDLGSEQAKAMIKAADLGTNIERLYQHELYFRSKSNEGERLSSTDLNRIYNNMTVWLWNDLDYRYESAIADELGFKRFTEFLNCYTADLAGGNTRCPVDLGGKLVNMNMVYGEDAGEYAGQMNPSYPLNYMEKPLTRLMLGRSFWDYDVVVDVRPFPGEPSGNTGGTSITLDMSNNTAAYYAGNRQATGQWAVAHQPFTVSVSGNTTSVKVTVALHDDLTGREKHELAMMRPPRMQKSFEVDTSTVFEVPYGGLIYVQGGNSSEVTINISGTVDAPLYDSAKNGWVNDMSSPAPIGDVVSDSFIFTAPKANLTAANVSGGVAQFADELDMFANDLNDFYAKNEGIDGTHNRAATHPSIPNNRHAFVNDVAISIGAAHSGYPVMNSSFNTQSNNINTDPLNSWLLWHEVGHNAAQAPLTVEGATEVANNVLALYMQQKYLGSMPRVASDIRIAPEYINAEMGHAWGAGGPGERLLMFAQMKEWAETEFNITHWYANDVPAYYNTDTGMNGFNLFKLMHRLSRNANDPAITHYGQNQCYRSGLGASDALMLCASYAAQTDLTAFFEAWNPGTVATILPGASEPQYVGGISDQGRKAVKALNLPSPQRDPIRINAVTASVPNTNK
ncbi:SslE/AcfD family lipoprotein zinc metalloprotease [Enterovibrio nigricans]|uniref:Accessory colonization factor AcfD n=1 Tax=Enterovibrio nigricans DSM 22720 TaxID=1121868 RepID=A0A1T4W3E1_9GAMM|nr:SslE/AcfD family lipoprotein zinc metalloprotease [Enterovibrio nigricans]SKA71241.1 accessory colonization factor AcfD [Enterovibrio nigricans DSM 22720]